MRLTDLPRTLAEVRPDTAWPAELQGALDFALARDAAERYQSAAQFGRDFAAACALLPDATTAEAGTTVLAPGDIPATRVARAGGATAASGGLRGGTRTTPSPAAPEPSTAKSRTPLIGGGIAALLVVAGLVWKLGPGSPSAPIAAGDSTATVAVEAGAPGASAAASGAPSEATSGAVQLYTRPVEGAGTVPQPGATARVDSGRAPTAAPAAAPTPTNPTPTNPTPSAPPATEPAPDPASRLPVLLRDAQSGGGARVLRELASLQPQLGGQALAESFYVQMIAYTAVEDQDGVCAAARQVIARHQAAARVTLARRAAELMACDGAVE